MIRKQKGMTLVEVLASLLITSLVIILIWTTILISIKYNIVESNKIQMQQEVNYIITDLQRIHREFNCYQIKSVNGEWRSIDCSNGYTISTYSNPEFKYQISGYPEYIYTVQKDAVVAGKSYSPSYPLKVKGFYADKASLILEITTTISRFDEQ